MKVLLARLDVFAGRYDEALRKLAGIVPHDLHFTWQYGEVLRLLGQSHYRLGDLAEAERIFTGLHESAWRFHRRVARTYSVAIPKRRDADPDEVKRCVAAIKKDVEEQEAASAQDREGRTFLVLPVSVDPKSSQFGLESGLTDVLALFLADVLHRDTPMTLVQDRVIHEVLIDPGLADLLSTEGGQHVLASVLGARYVIECRFEKVGLVEGVAARIMDAQSHEKHLARPVDVERHTDVGAAVHRLAEALWTVVQETAESASDEPVNDGAGG
ncbi:MAG TPA: hypothetical protein ENN80_07545 [Candidatus Hydrogenedentes bacterium]|nr:hypothetical protein [Candidatus Hydrogenedentota bacterium]